MKPRLRRRIVALSGSPSAVGSEAPEHQDIGVPVTHRPRSGPAHALRISAFRRYLIGQAISNTGTWMQRTAQSWLVLQLTHNSGSALGIVTALQFLPQAGLGLCGGTLADRYPRRRLLLLTQTSMALQALTLGILTVTRAAHLWHVYALAFALGVATALDGPARHAFIGDLVGPDQIPHAVSLNSAQFNGARIIGPAVACVAIAATGTGLVFLINAASYLAVVGALATVHRHDPPSGHDTRRHDTRVRTALRCVRAKPDLLLAIMIAGVVGTIGLNFQVTIPLAAKALFHSDAAVFGALTTSYAIGGLLGALRGTHRRTLPTPGRLFRYTLIFGLLEAGVGLMPTPGTFMALLVPTGFAAVLVTTTANAITQRRAPPAMRGRLMSLYILVLLGGTPLGATAVGWIAQHAGTRSSLIISGLICALSAPALATSVQARIRRQSSRAVCASAGSSAR